MFGGCPKFEGKKSVDAEQKLAKTTVLEFGEQNKHNISAFIFNGLFTSFIVTNLPNHKSIWRKHLYEP